MELNEIKKIILPFPLPQNTQVLFSDGSEEVYRYIHYLTTPEAWYGIVFNLENKCVLCNNYDCTIHIIRVFEKFDDERVCLFNFYLNNDDSSDDNDSSSDDNDLSSDDNDLLSDDDSSSDDDLSSNDDLSSSNYNFDLNELENQLVELDNKSDNSSNSDIDMDSINELDLEIKEIIYSNDPIYNFEYIPLDNVREILTHRDIYEFAYDNDIFHYGFPENETIITNEDENKLELKNDGEIWIRKLIINKVT
jgi:hypothetical protein